MNAGEKILFEDKERLNRLDLAITVLDGKILVVKALQDRIFDELIEAMILALADESALPMATGASTPRAT